MDEFIKISGKTTLAGILENALLIAPFPIVIFEGLDLKVTYANDALLQLWGKDRNSLGKTFVEILPELLDQPFPEFLRQVFITGKSHIDNEALAYIVKDGVPVAHYFDYSYTAIREADEEIIGVLVVCKDVTEQVEAKRKAFQSEDKFRNTVLQAPIAMAVVKGPGFLVETANAESLKLWGRTEKIIGQRVIDVFPEVVRQGFMEILNYVYQNGKPYYGNETAVDLVNESGERYTIFIDFVFHPIFENNEVNSIMTLGYNVTELVNARKVAQRSEADALVAKEGLEVALAKKDEFISVASHELKTPLTSLTGYLQVLERMQTDDRNRGFVVKAIQQLKKLSGLVSDLLDVSKIEAGGLQYKFESVDIRTLLEELIEQVKYANAGQQIRFESPVEQLILSIDKHRIEQVMANLLSNAIKYAPSSKVIEVKLTATDKEAKVEVRDYGMGIADDQQNKLFLKYHRVDEPNPVVSGMGIGLFICKEIIERHSGEIWVESEKGEGSCFGFRLPI